MSSYILKRVLISILVVFFVSILSFSVMHILPGEPARLTLGYDASEEDVQRLREQLNLDKPLLDQYWIWISGIFHGDFGMSIKYSCPVSDLLSTRIPRTLGIGIPALLLSTVIGVLFGIISAIKRGKFVDQCITLFSTVGIGTPVFWIGIMCIWWIGMGLAILPMHGYVSITDDFVEYLRHAAMPVFTMSLGIIATISRQTRSSMLDIINQDFIRTVRANGVSEGSVIYKHALRNALIPVITLVAMQVRLVIGGSVIVESVFNIPGVGQLLTNAILNRDYLIVQSCVLVIALVTVVCNLIVDLLYGFIDPRIRSGRGG